MTSPMLVHYHKHFRSYYLLSTLVGLNRNVNAVGTDGKKNLVDAVIRNYPGMHTCSHKARPNLLCFTDPAGQNF